MVIIWAIQVQKQVLDKPALMAVGRSDPEDTASWSESLWDTTSGPPLFRNRSPIADIAASLLLTYSLCQALLSTLIPHVRCNTHTCVSHAAWLYEDTGQ